MRKEDIDLSVQERNFELEKNWRELDMRMQERQAELDKKKEFSETQKAMTESLKSQTAMANILLEKLDRMR